MAFFHSDNARIVGKLTETPEGYLTGTAVIAREGILEYNEGGKIVRKLITRDELAKPESINSLKLKPVTNSHPFEMLDSATARQHQVGSHGENIRVDEGLLLSPIIITDSVAIRDIKTNNKRELSAGYYADIDDTPGVWNGQRYDCVQKNRSYNHTALCRDSRAGAVTTVHLDSKISVECGKVDYKHFDSIDNNIPPRRHTMKCTINGVSGEFTDEQVIAHIDSLNVTIQKSNKEHKDAIDLLTADRDNHKDKLGKLEKDHKAHTDSVPEMIGKAVKARIELERAATSHMDKADVEKIGTLSDLDIKKAVIKKAFPQVELKDASDVYIQARYESAIDVLTGSQFDSAAATNRQSVSGVPTNDSSTQTVASVDGAQQNVCNRYKSTTNRDAILKA